MTRRLAAILAADIAGYSRLMHEDEQATHARFTDLMTGAIEPAIAQCEGRIVKSTGDGFLAEFASAVQAVQCALLFQERIAGIIADDTPERRLEFRVGIHIGEVIVEERDIYGDGVNIAARLEALAEPGGVLVSEAVHENVRGRLPCDFEDLGAQQVKNIARPVRLFRILPAALRTRPAATRPPPRDTPAIIVLPFQNLSGDPEQDYFADGIVEDITTALSRFPSLFVIARNSAFTYKGRAVDVRQVGREQGARYVVEGSLRKAGSRLRITGQAIQTETGAHLWAERYDRDLNDVFALQDDMTTSIISGLVPSIRHAEIERARRKPSESLASYDLMLHALAAHNSLTQDGNEAARELLDRALTLDPFFVPALVLAASVGATGVANGWLPHDALARTLRHARLAVQLEPDDAEALATLAMRTAAITGDIEQSTALAERAIGSNPHSASVLRKSGLACLLAGRPDQALDLFERSLRLNPGDPAAGESWTGMGLALIALDRDAEAIAAGRRATQHNPASSEAARVLAAALALAGRADDARIELRRLMEIDPACSIETIRRRCGLREPAGARVLIGLRRAGLTEGRSDARNLGFIADSPGDSPGEPAGENATIVHRVGRPTALESPPLLVITRPGEPERLVPVPQTPLLLGRAPDSDVVLNDPKVSRAHCRIMLANREVIATDLKSTNGTLLDDCPIEGTVRLLPGAVLRIGPYQLEYRIPEPADPDRTVVMVAGGVPGAVTALPDRRLPDS